MNRQRLIRIFTFLGGLYFFLEYLLPEKIGDFQFSAYNDQITKGLMTVSAMAFGLGLINVVFIHGSKIAFLRKGWFNSVGLLLGLVAMLVITLREWQGSATIVAQGRDFSVLADFTQAIKQDFDQKKTTAERTAERIGIVREEFSKARTARLITPELPATVSPLEREQYAAIGVSLAEAVTQVETALNGVNLQADPSLQTLVPLASALRSVAQRVQEQAQFNYRYSFDFSIYQLLYEGFFIALGSAMFALLGFYMAAAAYRAFRVRSFESALMMGAAVIVMLGQIPFGLWIWDGFTDLRLWLLSTPSTAAFRAVKFGAAVAGLVMAFRMWLSIETDSFSNESGSGT
jgi:hypothetical protein